MDKLQEVYFIAAEIIIQMEEWMKRRDKKRTRLTYKKADQPRLLRLRTWSMRHHLPITEILDLLVPVLKERILYKSKYGFEIPVKVLTGAAAGRILRYEIAKRYDGNEHILAWREMERERQLRAERIEELEGIPLKPRLHEAMPENETVSEYVDHYTQSVMQNRQRERQAAGERWRRRKKYRNSPW